MNKSYPFLIDEKFQYIPTKQHTVEVDLDTDGKWRITALFEGAHMLSNTRWVDVFAALDAAWRVALVIRAITKEHEFVEVCEETMDMARIDCQSEFSKKIMLPPALALVMQNRYAGPTTVNRDA